MVPTDGRADVRSGDYQNFSDGWTTNLFNYGAPLALYEYYLNTKTWLLNTVWAQGTHTFFVCNRLLFFMVNVFDLPFAWAIAIYWKTWQKRKPWLKSLWHPEFARVIFPQKIALLPFQASQEKCRKIHASSRTFRSKIRPNGPKLTLQEN